MMQSIKGIFKDGVAHLSEPVSYPEPHPVIITFLDVTTSSKTNEQKAKNKGEWDKLFSAIESCQMETGISDLADQHDYYIYGKPKHD